MAETHVNWLSGSPLNRLSWLRSSTTFLSAVLQSDATRWIIFQGGQPLTVSRGPDDKSRALARLFTREVKPLLGPEPIFGQGKEAGQLADQDVPALEAARHRGPKIVFLGLEEPEQTTSALPSSEFSAKVDPKQVAANIEGTPFFSLDVTDVTQSELDEVLQSSRIFKTGEKPEFVEPRSAMNSFSAFDAAVFSEARSMIDWNARNQYCPACGSPTYSTWAGWKLACTSVLPWSIRGEGKECPSTKGLHNFAHPRTDPVVIMAVIDEAGEKILLGRNRRFPTGFYSTLAGFMEPGESFEDSVKREIWEEAGVRVWNVKYHSGQPWPYPANLMVGFYAYADPEQPIRIDLDNELVDAKWFTRAEVLNILGLPNHNILTQKEYKKFDDEEQKKTMTAPRQSESTNANSNNEEASHTPLAPASPPTKAEVIVKVEEPTQKDETPAFRVPPLTAIAGVLIRDWAFGKYGPTPASKIKGNL